VFTISHDRYRYREADHTEAFISFPCYWEAALCRKP